MRVVVTLEQRFQRAPDGSVWTPGMGAHAFWGRYLAVFDAVKVVARVLDVEQPPETWLRADGDGVVFWPVPHYVGALQYAVAARRVRRTVAGAVSAGDAVIMRVPSRIASDVGAALPAPGYPYAVEVIGDPRDVFAPGAVRHPLRALFRQHFAREMRAQCAGAAAACYVTGEALQRRYPCRGYSAGISDVDLPEEAFAERRAGAGGAPGAGERGRKLVFVGSLEQPYKAADVLLRAMKILAEARQDVSLTVVGDGRYLSRLQAEADVFCLADRVDFVGQVPPGEPVRRRLDEADLFVLPSRVEGMPRAMIEAMARGLPCVGSAVGGVPELLPPEDLVLPGDPAGLARRIREVLADPERMQRMSRRNRERAREFREELLVPRRTGFYRRVKELTEAAGR